MSVSSLDTPKLSRYLRNGVDSMVKCVVTSYRSRLKPLFLQQFGVVGARGSFWLVVCGNRVQNYTFGQNTHPKGRLKQLKVRAQHEYNQHGAFAQFLAI